LRWSHRFQTGARGGKKREVIEAKTKKRVKITLGVTPKHARRKASLGRNFGFFPLYSVKKRKRGRANLKHKGLVALSECIEDLIA